MCSLNSATAKQLPSPRIVAIQWGIEAHGSIIFAQFRRRCLCLQLWPEVIIQNGSIVRRNRKNHSDIWQFRWRESTSDGIRIYRRKEIGAVDQFPDLEAARRAASLLIPELNLSNVRAEPTSMTIAQLCSHFDQRELCLSNT
jgi:hypothetical protein